MTGALLVYATATPSHVHSQRRISRAPFGRPGGRAQYNYKERAAA